MRFITGTANFNVTRPLPQGDAIFQSEKLVSIRGYYFWQQLYGFPFVAVLTYAEQDLTSFEYDVIAPATTPSYYVGWPLLKGTPYYPVNGGEGTSSIDMMIQNTGPNVYTRPGLTYANTSVFIELHKYLNDLPGASNPGMSTI